MIWRHRQLCWWIANVILLLLFVGPAIGQVSPPLPSLSPPRLTLIPESIVRAPAGSSVSWTCQAVGRPRPVLRWTRETGGSENENGGVSLPNDNGNGTLTLHSLFPADEGRYQCWASNEAGVAAREVTLYVVGGSADKEDDYSLKIDEIIRATTASIYSENQHHNRNKPEVKHKRRSAEVKHAETALVDMDAFVRLVGALLRRSDGGKTVFPTITSTEATSDWLTPVQALSLLNYTGCVGGAQFQVLDCRPYVRFRSVTGICNNLGGLKTGAKSWGSAMTAFRRLLPARYEDGLMKPPGWFEVEEEGKPLSKRSQHPLPSPRLVSESLLSTRQVTADATANHLLMQWGQFLAHDLTFAAAPPRSWNILEDNVLDCRRTCRPRHVEPCFSVRRTSSSSSSQEPFLAQNSTSKSSDQKRRKIRRKLSRRKKPSSTFAHKPDCIEMVRSAELCGTGLTSLAGGRLVAREQVNALTAYIDGSQIYGSSVELARHLRAKSSPDRGLLKTNIVDGRKYLPLSEEHPMDCQLQPRSGGGGGKGSGSGSGGFMDCFLAGDHRANEHIGLLVMHNLWLRQHNRLARELRRLHPDWNGERLYQETKLIVGAQLQLITYRDWLPKIIGKRAMTRLLGPYRGYNASIDASISNVFATAAMRFGHTLVRSELVRKLLMRKKEKTTVSAGVSSSGNQTKAHHQKDDHQKDDHPNMNLRALFFASHLLYEPALVDSLLIGLAATPLKRPGLAEQAISAELTEHLFERSREAPLDLASLNIQRGRDHALPTYNSWRRFCGLKEAATFEELPIGNSSTTVRRKLARLYGSTENLDLWVGGILEEIIPEEDGSLPKVGATFRCLLSEQFRRLRDGDRHWFEAEGIFTPNQRAELERSTSLAEIVCANSDGGRAADSQFPVDAFLLPNDEGNPLVNCASLPKLDLSKW